MSDKMSKEFNFFLLNKDETESGGPIDRKNMYKWLINFNGPKESDYEGGKFHVEVNFPVNYPNEKPKCKFQNCDLLHPNIKQTGEVCFGNLKWKPSFNVLNLLNALYLLLKKPNFNDGWDNKQIKDYYEKNPDEYHKTVKQIVKQFCQD